MVIKDLYFTISEAAEELNVSRQTIYRWIADGKISTEKIGGVILVEKKAIYDYAHKRMAESFSQMMDNYVIERIRKKYGYSDKDQIVRSENEKDVLVFLITKENGDREKVRLGGADITLSMRRGKREITISDIRFTDMTKTESKHPKSLKKGKATK